MPKPKRVLQKLTPDEDQLHRARTGPKPKKIKDRVLKPQDMKPIRRRESSWSQRQKIRVLVFLFHHRVPYYAVGRHDEINSWQYRAPTQKEASEIYRVPQMTISNWVRKQERIESHSTHAVRIPQAVQMCQWPELESKLYNLFIERREQGQSIRTGWFRVHSIWMFRELYPHASEPTCTAVFRFSNGWFRGFLGRHRISLRCITKKAQGVPEDYHRLVVNWLQFNRRNSQPLASPNNWMEIVLCRAIGRYDLSNICNLDETPLPFEYLCGRTYNTIGAKTIWVKETKSGWNKRKASLVLCVFADGVNRIPPLILFHGEGKVYEKESPKYHPDVIVEFNTTAYMNDNLFLYYIEQYLMPVLGNRPTLFAIDQCSSHKTPDVLDSLRTRNIMPTLIPGGCTSLIQPLDVSINKPLKARIRDLTDEAIFACERIEDFEKWSVGDRRVLTTWCVGDAWYQFCVEKQDLVTSVFRKVGLSLPIDGSADHELDIKGFAGIAIGDWKSPNDELDLDFLDVNREHDDCDSIDFVADGE